MSKNKPLLYIEPYCYVSFSKNEALIYNTLSKEQLIVKSMNIRKLLIELTKEKNGMSVFVEKSLYHSDEFESFLKELKMKFMGDVIASIAQKKPFTFSPKPYFEKDIKNIEKDSDLGYFFSTEIVNYLNEITFQITDKCDLKCSYCSEYYKQFDYCSSTKGTSHKEISYQLISSFLMKIFELAKINVNITGGNIFSYSELENLLSLLSKNPAQTRFIVNYLNFDNIASFYTLFSKIDNFLFEILVNPFFDKEKLRILLNNLHSYNINFIVKFVVDSEIAYNQAEGIMDNFPDTSFAYVPFSNSKNRNFIVSNVFLNKNDINSISVDMKNIYSNTTINSFDYGKLLIDPKGRVFANPNFPSIGNINTDTLFKLIFNELSKGNSWRRIRNNSVCNDCLYQFLCPSPSNIELSMKSNIICNFKK